MNTFYKLYIFDLDGTLLNTIGDLAAAANFALQKNGLPPRTLGLSQQRLSAGIRRPAHCGPPGRNRVGGFL